MKQNTTRTTTKDIKRKRKTYTKQKTTNKNPKATTNNKPAKTT